MTRQEELDFVIEQLYGYASTLKSERSISDEMDKQIEKERDIAVDLVIGWCYEQ